MGGDYGWPATEGVPGAPSAAFYTYPHPGRGPGDVVGRAVTGGAICSPPCSFGASYAGKYFFADWAGNWVKVADFSQTTVAPVGFAQNIRAPVDLEFGPDGALYMASHGNPSDANRGEGAAIYKVVFGSGPPAITIQPRDPGPLSAGETVELSFTAFGRDLTYQWLRNGAPIAGATTPRLLIDSVGSADAGATLKCRVTGPEGVVDTNVVTLNVVTNRRPVALIESPAPCVGVQPGQIIQLKGWAFDVEGTPLLPLHWTVTIHHNGHTHPACFTAASCDQEGSSVTYTVPGAHDAGDVFLRIAMTATEAGSGGLSRTVYRDLYPNP
jgi:cytochrome c